MYLLQNILTFTPPGFKQTLSVKYPDSRLPVCFKCKKNFKTRDMCRVRNTHTDPPWTTAYVCITMDDSCTDENGNFVDKPLTLRMVQWQPFAVRQDFSPKTPVCSACKRTNRTKNFCRERHKHRHLPWCTVYVLLSALENADPNTVVAGSSKPAPTMSPEASIKTEGAASAGAPENVESGLSSVQQPTKLQTSVSGTPPTDSSHSTVSPPEVEKKSSTEEAPVITEIATEPPGQGDDIHDVADSRTFLALVSSRGTSIHWLELVEYEENMSNYPPPAVAPAVESPYVAPGPPTPVDHGHPPPHFYAAHAAAYAQQQHQSTLKSHQQYFFQLQQQQQAQQSSQRHGGAPPAPPPHGYPQWQQYSPMEMPTAGEAAAARRRGEELGHPGVAAMWPMYGYPHTPMYPMMPPPPGTPGLMPPHVPPHHPHHGHMQQHHHHHHHPHAQQHSPPPPALPYGGRENGNGAASHPEPPYTPTTNRTTPPQQADDQQSPPPQQPQTTEENEEDDDGENNQDEDERDTKRLRTV